jgi:hypothetical protein
VSILQIVQSCGGWNLIDDGKLSLWFPERDKALEIACLMADARRQFGGTDTIVQDVHADQAEVLAYV